MTHLEEISVLWSAPITKFYTNFVAYIVFLAFFTLAVMWPSCGNLLLDCFVWFWTASIAFENTRVAYEKYCVSSMMNSFECREDVCSSLRVVYLCNELCWKSLFKRYFYHYISVWELLVYGILEVRWKRWRRRLTKEFFLFLLACQILTAKSILGVGLIYYYYRILFIFLPISPKLGPMMIRLRCMVS